jgi:hypothetical protein
MPVQTQMQVRRGTASSWTSTNPTLAAGELGFETDTGKFKIGTGSSTWTALPYAGGGQNTLTTYQYTATAGQTTFSGADINSNTLSYTAGAVQVYLNGALLQNTVDYAASTGTSVVLTAGAGLGDSLTILSLGSFTVSTDIPKSTLTAKGSIIAASGAATPANLSVGANDTVLTADSSTATGLKWATPAAGGMTLISETVASSLSSLSFSSLGSYKQLLLVWAGVRHSANGSAFSIRFNNDSNTIYPIQGFQADSTFTLNATNPDAIQGSNNITIFSFGRNVTNGGAGTDVAGSLLIDNYTSTTKSKYYEIKMAYYDVSSATYGSLNAEGFFNTTTAITSIDIVRLSGSATFSNQNNTTIRLYGVS